MADSSPDILEIFSEAVSRRTAEERVRYIEETCGENPELLQRVESLLRAHFNAGSFLAGKASEEAPTILQSIEKLGAQIGPYKLIEQIGEGGMGVVWMAEQTVPVKRKVALKLIKAGMDSRQVITRFEAERQALSLMDHVNIARVLDAGTTDQGRPFFVMELVHGVPITKYCDENHLTPRERLELFVPVCQAIQHAHQKGIIHRDIKPSNVLVTLYDGRPVPKVIDFGVAKATEQKQTERSLFTQYGTLVGTLEYMSPEQAEMSALGIDTRSDIYSLGVLLYELLTGSTPLNHKRIKEAAYAEVLRLIKEEEPQKPSTRLSDSGEALASISALRHTEPAKLTRLVRGELDWIVMKSLEKDRSRRYETANGFAADVQHFLADEPVSACPPSAAYRFRKFARRNKVALGTAFVMGFAVLVAVAASVRSTVLIAQEQQVTEGALEAETRAKEDLKQNLQRERRETYFQRIALAHRELDRNDLGRALPLLEECPKDLRQWEWHYLMRLCRVEPVILRQKSEINSIAFSPNGDRLASAGGDGNIKIWNRQTWKIVQTLRNAHGEFVSSVVFHPDGKHLASVGADKKVKVWDLTTGQPVFSQDCDSVHAYGTAYAVAFNLRDDRQLAAGNEGAVNIWDWKNGRLLHNLSGHDKRPISVAFSPGGRLASGSWQGSVKLWNVASQGQLLATYGENGASRHPAAALAFHPDGRRLAAASYDRRVDVWDTKTGEHAMTLPQSGLVICVAYSPDGKYVASSGEGKTVHLWDAETGREVLGLRGHIGNCGCVTFSPDGWLLASAGKDGTIRIWDASPLQDDEGQETTFGKNRDEIWTVAVSPDGHSIASGGLNMPVKVWNIASRRVTLEFHGQGNIIFDVAWHPDGRRIASAGRIGELFTVKVWDARTGKEAFALPAGTDYFSAAFSPDGRYLVTGRANLSVQVWNAETGEAVGTLGTHKRVIHGVVFSRDGRHLASVSDEGVVNLWDATRLDAEQTPRQSVQGWIHGQCLNITFSPDGSRLATGGEENTVKIWDVETGRELQTLRGHTADVSTLAFRPDNLGRWIASAGEDSTVKIWNSQTGQLVHSFRGHVGQVSSLAFTPDGRRLVSGSRDHTIRIWDVTEWDEVPEP